MVHSFFKSTEYRIRRWTFDVRCSSVSFLIRLDVFLASGPAYMKVFVISAISLLTLWCLSCPAKAGWLIDHERFHISVHGQLSCQDCHGSINEKRRHPDPVDVNRSLTDFF